MRPRTPPVVVVARRGAPGRPTLYPKSLTLHPGRPTLHPAHPTQRPRAACPIPPPKRRPPTHLPYTPAGLPYTPRPERRLQPAYPAPPDQPTLYRPPVPDPQPAYPTPQPTYPIPPAPIGAPPSLPTLYRRRRFPELSSPPPGWLPSASVSHPLGAKPDSKGGPILLHLSYHHKQKPTKSTKSTARKPSPP